jgi:hypothetical protein
MLDQEEESKNDAKGDEGSRPAAQEHCSNREDASYKAQPLVVVAESGSPTDWLDQVNVKRGEIDEGVRAQVAVGDERRNHVQFSCITKS